jgi:transposase
MTQPAPSIAFTLPKVFCAALELSAKQWRLAFTEGERTRQVTIQAGDFEGFKKETEKARARLKLPEEEQLHSCYEAGRDGFWIHRRLEEMDVKSLVLESSSIKVDRRAKRAKSDGLDAKALAEMLVRYVRGDRSECRVVKVPSVEMEDGRRPDRERERLTKEKTQHQSRIRALLATQGVVM